MQRLFLCPNRKEAKKIDPATFKIVAQAVIQTLKDEEARKRLLIILLIPVVVLVLIIGMFFHIVTMPFQLLGNIFFGDSHDKVTELRIENGYDLYINTGESTGELIWAVDAKYSYISSYFGKRISPITGKEEHHNGIDIPADYGMNVYAALAGTVIIAEYHKSYGNYIIIQHDDGKTTFYAHNSTLLKKVGDEVLQGEAIAKVGSTGDSTGNHLHFEIQVNNTPQNPLDYIAMPEIPP